MVTQAFPIVSSRVMSTRTDSPARPAKGTTVSFGEHFAASDQFDAIFKESMGLTTRLLELASWLMIRRALKEGEITTEEARAKRERVKLRGPARTSHVKGFADLPLGLRQLIDASYAMSDRIFQLDRAIAVVVDQALATDNPVGAQVTRLEEAFSKPRR